MNILFVCSAKTWGGNEKWTSMAMKHLSDEHNIFFFGRNRKLGDAFGKTNAKGFAPMFATWDIYSFFIAWRFLKKHDINCVVSTKKKEYFIFGLLTRLLKIKHLIRLGIVRDMNRPLWHRLIYNRLNNGIIVNAHRIEKNLRRYTFMQNKQVFVIYNTIPELEEISNIEKHKTVDFNIVSTGMLTKRKGFHVLSDAVALLKSECKSSLHISYVGSGRESENLEKQIHQLGLEKTIRLSGFHKEPNIFLKSAKLFVLLSSNEGISNALIEAMAAGVPVLTTDSGGSTEFIFEGKNGFITTRNPQAVANKLEEILRMDSKKLEKIGLKGQETVLKLFNEKRFDKELKQIFLISGF